LKFLNLFAQELCASFYPLELAGATERKGKAWLGRGHIQTLLNPF